MRSLLSKNNMLALCLLSFLATSCSQEMEEVANNSQSIKMLVNASREDIVASRVTHEEVNGNMVTTWAEGDQLLVTNESGNKLGVINLVEGAGEKTGQFEGDLTGLGSDGTVKLNYFYLGNAVTDPAQFDGNLSMAAQDGALTSLNQYDVLSSNVEVSIQGGTSYVENIGLKRNFLFAHFTLNFPEGVSMNGESITISGTNVKNGAAINWADATYTATDGSIVVSGTQGDFYINMIPAQQVALNFSVTIDEKEYTGTLSAVDFNRNAFIRKAQAEGIPVTMETEIVDTEWVDLSLTSGTLWRDRNIGAETVTESGNYFGWGDVTGNKTSSSASQYGPTSYSGAPTSTESSYGTKYYWQCVTNEKYSSYDIAAYQLGEGYTMPTPVQIVELMNETNHEKTTLDGVVGYKFTSKKDTSKWIFIPSAGYKLQGDIKDNGYMYVWSSEIHWYQNRLIGGSYYDYDYNKRGIALNDYLGSKTLNYGIFNPAFGFPVRPVKK